MIDYASLGQTDEEIALLRAHDEHEELHPYEGPKFPDSDGTPPACLTCGDDSSGLLHNNTWRNVEPLMQTDVAVTYTFVVTVPVNYLPGDVSQAVNEYINSVGFALDNPIKVEEV